MNFFSRPLYAHENAYIAGSQYTADVEKNLSKLIRYAPLVRLTDQAMNYNQINDYTHAF